MSRGLPPSRLRRLKQLLLFCGCMVVSGLARSASVEDDDPLPPLPPVTQPPVPNDWSAWRGVSRLTGRSVVDYSSSYQRSSPSEQTQQLISEQVIVRFDLEADEDLNLVTPGRMHWRVVSAHGGVSRFDSSSSDSSFSSLYISTTSQGSYSGAFSLRIDPHLSFNFSDGKWGFPTLHELTSPMAITTSGYVDNNGSVSAVSEQIQVTDVSDTSTRGVAPRRLGIISGSADEGESTMADPYTKSTWTRTGRIEFWPDRDDVEVAIELQPLSEAIGSFQNWRPEGNLSDPSAPGPNPLQAKATLRPRGKNPTPDQIASLPIVRRFRFEMRKTSKEPGVCMNWPILASVPAEDPDYDLRFAVAIPGRTVLSPKRQKAGVEPVVDNKNQPTAWVRIDCYDFGATSELAVIAELGDGTELVGAMRADPNAEALHPVPIPDRDPGTRIARVWRTEMATQAPDEEDGDNEPMGDGQNGDGFSVWEEYRGFRVGGIHETSNPAVKDLFLVNRIGPLAESGIQELEYITQKDDKRGIRIYYNLQPDELPESRIMNLNRGPSSPRSGTEPQTGLILEGFRSSGKLRISFVDVPKGVSFRPKNTKRIVVNLSGDVDELTRTVAHEIAHSIGVLHHGESDPGATRWEMGVEPLPGGGTRRFFSERQMGINRATGKLTNDVSTTEIRVFSKDRKVEFTPGNGGPGLPTILWVADRGGQHSGVADCIMRYSTAQATAPFRITSKIRIYVDDADFDTHNYSICTDCLGTGVNDVQSEPNLFGNASLGDCFHQLCVRDSAPVLKKLSTDRCKNPDVKIP